LATWSSFTFGGKLLSADDDDDDDEDGEEEGELEGTLEDAAEQWRRHQQASGEVDDARDGTTTQRVS